MTSNNLRELRLAGMTIGGHTVNHPLLARLTSSEQVRRSAAAPTGCLR